ncbi:hypothetical protein NDU88_009050 [Pleurodeles waltl]|uniref:Uncharacterized protein n=1 Tax=Pleurodeles waltl TaxID=8319 RepID=A0AAV7QQF3_PLEWA|nr:hypothetical protein NDU88_009050 [Pleurodeles waltl]
MASRPPETTAPPSLKKILDSSSILPEAENCLGFRWRVLRILETASLHRVSASRRPSKGASLVTTLALGCFRIPLIELPGASEAQ